MKKLMTMIAAVGMAFGLFADVGFKAGTCFNSWTGTNVAERIGDESITWSGDLYECSLINPAGWEFTPDKIPAQWSGEDPINGLNIKTPLTSFVTCEASFSKETDDKIYVDTLVKFTAFDVDDTANVADGKLGVWIKEMANGKTNLLVTAGTIDESVVSEKVYDCGEYKGGDWCRLTVKSMGQITASGNYYGFVVYVDGKPVSPEDETISFGTRTLKPEMQFYKDANILFPSLGSSDITTLGFAGQGVIDDIAFTTTAPSFAVDMLSAKITLGEGVTPEQLGTTTIMTNGFLASGLDLSSGSATIYYEKGTTCPPIRVDWTGAGDVLAGFKQTGSGATSLEITADNLTHANVYIGSKGYANVTAALEDAQANDIITLSNNVSETAITVGTAVTLDLNGKVLTAAITATAALTIANTDETRDANNVFRGQLQAGGAQVAGLTGSNITIDGGYINGAINGSAFANGGQFAVDPTDDINGITLAEDKTADKISESPEIWEVVDKPAIEYVTFTVSYEASKVENVTVKTNGEDVVGVTGNYIVESNAVVTITATAKDGFKNVAITGNNVEVEDGVFTADKAESTITITADAMVYAKVPDITTSYTYNGTEQTAQLDNGEGYVVVGDSDKQTNAGVHKIEVALAVGYDAWEGDDSTENKFIDWTIAQAVATVRAVDQTIKVGESPAAYTATVSPAAFGADVIAYTVTCPTYVDAEGEYAIVVALGDNPNYDLTPYNGTLKVEKAGPVIPEPEDLPEAEKAAYDNWYTSNPADPTDVALSKPEDLKDAYLLGCKAGEEALEAAREDFKFASIEFKNGEWVATIKNSTGDEHEFYGNGAITVKSYSDVECKTEAENGNFFKATLGYKPAND